jgi:hypothetical protein
MNQNKDKASHLFIFENTSTDTLNHGNSKRTIHLPNKAPNPYDTIAGIEIQMPGNAPNKE